MLGHPTNLHHFDHRVGPSFLGGTPSDPWKDLVFQRLWTTRLGLVLVFALFPLSVALIITGVFDYNATTILAWLNEFKIKPKPVWEPFLIGLVFWWFIFRLGCIILWQLGDEIS